MSDTSTQSITQEETGVDDETEEGGGKEEDEEEEQRNIVCEVCGGDFAREVLVPCKNNGPDHELGCHTFCMPGDRWRAARSKLGYYCAACSGHNERLPPIHAPVRARHAAAAAAAEAPARAVAVAGRGGGNALARMEQPSKGRDLGAAQRGNKAAATERNRQKNEPTTAAAIATGRRARILQQLERNRQKNEATAAAIAAGRRAQLQQQTSSADTNAEYTEQIGQLAQISCQVVQAGVQATTDDAEITLDLKGHFKLCKPMEVLASEQQRHIFRDEMIPELATPNPGKDRRHLAGGIFDLGLHPNISRYADCAYTSYRPLKFVPVQSARISVQEQLRDRARFIVVSLGQRLLVFLPTPEGELLLLMPLDAENTDHLVYDVVNSVVRDLNLGGTPSQLEARAEQAQQQQQQQPTGMTIATRHQEQEPAPAAAAEPSPSLEPAQLLEPQDEQRQAARNVDQQQQQQQQQEGGQMRLSRRLITPQLEDLVAVPQLSFYLLGFSLDSPGLMDSITAAKELGATVHYEAHEQVLQALRQDLGLPADAAAAAAATAAVPVAAEDDDVIDLTVPDAREAFCQAVVLLPEHTSPERLQELLGPGLPLWRLLACSVAFFTQSTCRGPLCWLWRKQLQLQQRQAQQDEAHAGSKRARSAAGSAALRRRRRQCNGGWQEWGAEEGEMQPGLEVGSSGAVVRLPGKLREYQLFRSGVAVLMESFGLNSASKGQLQQLLALLAAGQAQTEEQWGTLDGGGEWALCVARRPLEQELSASRQAMLWSELPEGRVLLLDEVLAPGSLADELFADDALLQNALSLAQQRCGQLRLVILLLPDIDLAVQQQRVQGASGMSAGNGGGGGASVGNQMTTDDTSSAAAQQQRRKHIPASGVRLLKLQLEQANEQSTVLAGTMQQVLQLLEMVVGSRAILH
ncbi:hypothetical protein OEZ85_010991 [Tetradesmus obliquus]|uniref:Rhodanese domain-containing protein n=1 Tax=Tetradesmus obliquus TaxID=3088 RepID=A0ABY8TNW7_TETOB|nr:hypothetical protein OEZ85_010991 [Tetradesmus obliquus]